MLARSDLAAFEAKASDAARTLKLLANRHRLLILCQLAMNGEMTVGAITAAIKLSQSAVSQHLAKMRREGLVTSRREAQMIHYRVLDPDAARILELLKEIYCRDLPSQRKTA